eukprot:scaffold12795_cov94-Cylindrotheca_fusiformis.AAC.1
MEMAATTTEMSDKQVLLRDSRDAVIVVDQLSMFCLSVLREIVVPESNGTTDKITMEVVSNSITNKMRPANKMMKPLSEVKMAGVFQAQFKLASEKNSK